MRLTQFGTITLPELNGRDNINNQARNNLIELQDGSYDLDGNEVYLTSNTISRTAVVDTDIDNTVDNLFREMKKGRMILKAEMRDNSERQTFAKMNVSARPVDARDYNCQQPIDISWNINYPYWLRTLDEPLYLDHGYELDDSLTLDAGNFYAHSHNGTSSNFTVTNNSGFRIYRLYVSIVVGISGGVHFPTLTNNTTGQSLYINRYNSVNSRIDINPLEKTIYNYSSPPSSTYSDSDLNIYDELTPSDKINWLYLEPGVNSFTYATPALTSIATIYVVWSTHYV